MNINEKGIDQSGFDLIFNQWYEPIRNFIYYKTGNAYLAEDIAQDTFLKIWKKRDDIKTGTIKAFLFTIAANLLNNKMDHQKVSFKFINSYQQPGATAAPDFELEIKEFNHKLQKVQVVREMVMECFLSVRVKITGVDSKLYLVKLHSFK